ncbi:MAG: alanine racemase [candidate division Zixibacteria bacterium]|nr:alanine racemase [candidate division Zixibacteria bacterium]MCI0596512.1 alanine racemase [candidate division Zixibacteria bacterium]
MDRKNSFDRPSRLLVDLDRLAKNVRLIKKQLGGKVDLMAVVKADGYGHGTLPVTKIALASGASSLGVAFVEEGVALRKAGIKVPIAVLYPDFAERAEFFVRYNLIPTILDEKFGRAYLAASRKLRIKKTPFSVKVETGLNRYGIPAEAALRLTQSLLNQKGAELWMFFSHLATAGETDFEFVRRQVKKMKDAQVLFEKAGIVPRYTSLANSGAVLDAPETYFNLARVGVLLFGYPSKTAIGNSLPVQPIMTLESQIAQLKTIAPGETVSYGREFASQGERVIATLPLGFSDGYPRHLGNKGWALVRGMRAPVVGRIAMDAVMVDVTAINGVKIGDRAVLLGEMGNEKITAEDLAGWIGTSAYEIMTRMGVRLPIEYTGRMARKLGLAK